MVLHCHHVPGRMRVRLEALQRNQTAASPLRSELLALPGVRSASINAWSGSVIVHYDRDVFEPETFWTVLRRLGYVDRAPRRIGGGRAAGRGGVLAGAIANAVVEAVAIAVLERVVGRSAGAVVRLLI